VSHPPFNGTYAEITGWRYSSGAGHFAYDYVCPLGTPLFAVLDGSILDCNDGVPNDTPWDPDYPNEPSNWVLLGATWRGKPVSVYYQHMSPGLNVHRGQRVEAGQQIGRSGDSGNTTGPHLHIATMYGHWAEATRYIYMQNDGTNPYVIFPPDLLWKDDDDMALTDEAKDWLRDMVADTVRREVWNHKLPSPAGDGPETFHRAASRWQRRTIGAIAEASAEATIAALKAAGMAQGVNAKAVARQVSTQVTAEFAELLAADDQVAPPPTP
jgi:hypothetical protein